MKTCMRFVVQQFWTSFIWVGGFLLWCVAFSCDWFRSSGRLGNSVLKNGTLFPPMYSKSRSQSDIRIYNIIPFSSIVLIKILLVSICVPGYDSLVSRSECLSLIALVVQVPFQFSCRAHDLESCVAFKSRSKVLSFDEVIKYVSCRFECSMMSSTIRRAYVCQRHNRLEVVR